MAVLKCNFCGGELEVNADMSVGICKYCDSVNTIPKELDRKGHLYNRAVFHRQNNDFDKAEGVYEDILKEDNADAEAHWGLVLSKFGIEYVLDPKTQERIPTCHRTQQEPVLSDPDYLAAVQYADSEAKRVFEKEAGRIQEIQRRILEISQKEPPYDIFICYKESDERGNRTEDSLLAQELYYELIKKGYKVFFARKTLENKLGAEYEPIIYAALSSSKVMIVLGTRPEHFNSVWVRNEWSRFRKMSRDNHKALIPAYRGMSPYELPVELSSLQSQDMSKLGFMQDLIDGIERWMRSGKQGENIQKEIPVIGSASSSLERLLQNAQTYIKLENYSSAEETYTMVTKKYPEDFRGWWGLIVCQTRNFSEIIQERATLNMWFKYVKKLADSNEFSELEEKYIEYIYKISSSDAMEDMKLVNSIIGEYNGKIRKIENNILLAEQKKKSEIKDIDETIKKKQESWEWNQKHDYKPGMLGIWSGILGICISFFVSTNINLFWGILILFTGLIVSIGFSSKASSGKDWMDRLKNEMRDTEKRKPEIEKKYNAEIKSLREDILPLEVRIVECQSYLDLGKKRITSIWFEDECKKVDVQRLADSSIKECRKKVFRMEDSVVKMAVNIFETKRKEVR